MRFFESLDEDDLQDFTPDMGFYSRGIEDALNLAREVQDPTFAKEIEDLVGQYSVSAIRD